MNRTWRTVPLLVVLLSCSSGVELAAPVEAPPTTVAGAASPAQQCTAEQQEQDPTRSYAPNDEPTPSVDEIRQRGRLIVGVSGDTLLFGSRNPLTGRIEGFDIDILTAIAVAIFGEGGENKIEYRIITYADRIPRLLAGPSQGGVDLVAHTMTINCSRWLRIAFSSVYFNAGQKLLVRRDSDLTSIEELASAGLTLCAPEGSTNIEFVQQPEFVDAGLVVAGEPDITDCLVGIQQGVYDAATSDDTVLAGFAAQDPNVEVVGDALTEEPYGIGIAADRIDLVRFVNAELEAMRNDGRWAAIYQRWLIDSGALGGPVPSAPPATYGREDG
jgi:polar amino acid transport system substrate-binding protein